MRKLIFLLSILTVLGLVGCNKSTNSTVTEPFKELSIDLNTLTIDDYNKAIQEQYGSYNSETDSVIVKMYSVANDEVFSEDKLFLHVRHNKNTTLIGLDDENYSTMSTPENDYFYNKFENKWYYDDTIHTFNENECEDDISMLQHTKLTEDFDINIIKSDKEEMVELTNKNNEESYIFTVTDNNKLVLSYLRYRENDDGFLYMSVELKEFDKPDVSKAEKGNYAEYLTKLYNGE